MTVDHPAASLLDAVPHLVVRADEVVSISPSVAAELGCEPSALLGPIEAIGTRLDDGSFDELLRGEIVLRVRLGSALGDRPVRMRRLGAVDDRQWIELRSLAGEFRAESLLRRSGMGHMLISPDIELQWSMSANDLSDVFPGDNPLNWIELMDPDDMQTLGKAIFQVGKDPNLRQVVQHRLRADRTYTIIDTVESAMHDPDLRAVLVRSKLADSFTGEASGAAPYAGITVSDHMPIGVVVASASGIVLHRNAVAAELVGARAGQAITPSDGDEWLLASLSPQHSAQFLNAYSSAARGRAAHCTIPAPNDDRRWLRIAVSPATASTVVITIEDMTDLAEAERALRASNRLLEALDSHSEELVIVFDAHGNTRYTSSSVQRRLGARAMIEHVDDATAFVHPADRETLAELTETVRATTSSHSVEFRVDTGGDPQGRWHHATMTNLVSDPDVQGLVLTLRDIHERYVAERELRFRATHDALTNLPDRSAFTASLEERLNDIESSGRRVAVLFCDIDHFKQINDDHGHGLGDQVLAEVGERLRGALRATDIVGRFGGDEFVVVLADVDDSAHAVQLAERILAAVTGPATFDDVHLDISASVGVALSGKKEVGADALVQQADAAMYESKRAGRGRLSLYQPVGGE
jgi:diguanylate cyclase (GGDEF)-like protein/PAS domain S-box-containing protein